MGKQTKQSGIFMSNFQVYQDTVREIVRIAMLRDLNSKFSFCFYINSRASHISALFMFT